MLPWNCFSLFLSFYPFIPCNVRHLLPFQLFFTLLFSFSSWLFCHLALSICPPTHANWLFSLTFTLYILHSTNASRWKWAVTDETTNLLSLGTWNLFLGSRAPYFYWIRTLMCPLIDPMDLTQNRVSLTALLHLYTCTLLHLPHTVIWYP